MDKSKFVTDEERERVFDIVLVLDLGGRVNDSLDELQEILDTKRGRGLDWLWFQMAQQGLNGLRAMQRLQAWIEKKREVDNMKEEG